MTIWLSPKQGSGSDHNGSVPLVLDVKGGQTTAGTPVIASTKKSSEADHQLWRFVPDGLMETLWFLAKQRVSKATVILFSTFHIQALDLDDLDCLFRGRPISPNQIWIKVP